MTRPIRRTMFIMPWGLMLAGTGFAQTPPATSPDTASDGTSQTPLYDPTQFPSSTGRVQQFTLTPFGARLTASFSAMALRSRRHSPFQPRSLTRSSPATA